MRIMRRGWGLAALFAASLILTNGALPASDTPVVHVKAEVKDGTVSLEALANGPFEYTTYRPSESLFVVDLSGVSNADPAGARIVASELVKSYRTIAYTSGGKPVVRLEVLLSQGVEPKVERKDHQELLLVVTRASDLAAKPAVPAHSSAPELNPVASANKAGASAYRTIDQVSLAQDNGQTLVNVVGSGRLTYHASRLENPNRLVLDFEGAHLKTSSKQIPSNLDPVREIRVAQFSPEVSRVVIDLREPARYNINATGNAVTVEFTQVNSTGGAAAKPADAPAPMQSAKLTAPIVTPAKLVVDTKPAAAVPAPTTALPASMTHAGDALAIPAGQPGPGRQHSSGLGEVLGRTDFRKLEGRGPARLFPIDPRNQRPQCRG